MNDDLKEMLQIDERIFVRGDGVHQLASINWNVRNQKDLQNKENHKYMLKHQLKSGVHLYERELAGKNPPKGNATRHDTLKAQILYLLRSKLDQGLKALMRRGIFWRSEPSQCGEWKGESLLKIHGQGVQVRVK